MQKVGVRDATGRFIDAFDLMVQLPWGALTSVVVHHDMTIMQLKSVVEFAVGLPADLMTIGYRRSAALDEHYTLRELRMIPGDRINVIIEYGFEEIVAGAVSGSTQKVINDISRHWDEDDVARRRTIVMFISAHRGYHFLVERMLEDGAHPDSVSPSGRTALHIACAMGNGGCIDALLQRGANTTLKDANNKTPAQLAFSCGQQEAERRLVLYERARKRQTRRISKQEDWLQTLPSNTGSSWSRTPRFPVSRLARSVTPTLALQELSLSPAPGPELHVKSLRTAVKTTKAARDWSVRRLTQADIGHFDNSSESSIGSEHDNDAELTHHDGQNYEGGEKVEENFMTPDTSRSASITDDTISMGTSPRPPTSPAIRPPHLLRTTAWQQDGRRVRFENPNVRTTPRIHSAPLPKSLGAASVTNDLDFEDSSSLKFSADSKSARMTQDSGNTNRPRRSSSANIYDRAPVNSTTAVRPVRAASARVRSARYNPHYPDDRYGQDEIMDMRRIKDVQAALEVSVGLRETTEQPLLSNGRRKATPDENCRAFNDWLESKVQGAKDRKLLNHVQRMLDEAFGRADEEIKRQEEKLPPKKTGQSFDDWKKQKEDEARKRKKEAQEKQRKEEEARQHQASVDAENELLIKAWILRRNQMERQRRQGEARDKREKQRRLVEQQHAAQSAFQKWRLNKEWEELVKLREGMEFFDKAGSINKLSFRPPLKRKRVQSASSLRSNGKPISKTAS
ncbi:uncharacterized protein [Diadema antillarum]|uniref:uncharacterized protein n=1 Tax=Diadema antillarum TaxID=105358 RepID=UPI003A88F346